MIAKLFISQQSVNVKYEVNSNNDGEYSNLTISHYIVACDNDVCCATIV